MKPDRDRRPEPAQLLPHDRRRGPERFDRRPVPVARQLVRDALRECDDRLPEPS